MPKKSSKLKSILIRQEIHQKIKVYCAEKGYPIGFFIEFLASKHIPPREKD